MPVTWVLWDVGGVLADVDDATWPARWEARWSVEVGLPAAEFRDRLAAADLPDSAVRSGVETAWWEGVGKAVGAGPDVVARMRADFWDAYCGRPNTELLRYAASLTGRVGLAILSNSGDGARQQEERRFGFSRVFDPICYSHELGRLKPDPAAYLGALTAMGARPDEVLFVDNAERAVVGARACGIRSVLHVDNATTIAAVEEALAG